MSSIHLRDLVVLVSVSVGLVLADCGWTFAQSGATTADPQQNSQPEAPVPAPINETPSGETDDLGYRVLMQGPVHEAFAAPIDTDLTDGVRVYSKAPPEPVDEQPPEASSVERGMKWIPGYWSWSDDEDGYVWVSGLWRKFPPGRTWISGDWTKTGSGYRWTSGYWSRMQSSSDAVEYLPLPPKSIDNGPSVPPPADDSFWVPGNWKYADGDYHWRGGFWSASQPDWIWRSGCYVHTTQGCVWVEGYWDYLPSNRGQLYAPVTFYNSAYLRQSYVYRPHYPLANAATLLLNLFVRPGYPHYYCGDFRGRSHLSLGYRPWYDHSQRLGYASPFLSYFESKYRKSGISFVGSMQRYESHLRAKPKPTTPHRPAGKQPTFAASRLGKPHSANKVNFGRALDNVVRSDIGRVSAIQKRSVGSEGRKAIIGPTPSVSRSNRLATPQVNHHRGLPSGRSFVPRSMQTTPSLNRSSPFSRSSDTPSIRSNPSIGRGLSRSIRPSQSFQRVPSKSFHRSASPSMNRGGAASNVPRRSDLGGGSNRGGFGSGGFKSGGSKGRGRGKK